MAQRPVLADCARVIDAVRARPPSVHAITSPVAAERTANTLLALGIRPSLTVNPAEMEAFVAAGDALLVNLGMLDPTREAAIGRAVAAAQRLGRPWVLDPVFAEVSPDRATLTRALLALGPAAFKTNRREAALAEAAGPATVTIVTGEHDRLAFGARRVEIANGHALAGSVTAMGCALGAVVAACLARCDDALTGAAAAVTAYGIAAEQAAARSAGPGSFAVVFYDCLAALDGKTLLRKGRLA